MDIIKPAKKNLILDASMLSTYLGCSLNYDLRFNKNFIPLSGKSNPLESGSLVHTNLEFFGLNKIKGFKRDLCITSGFAAMDEYYHGCTECKKFDIDQLIPCERHGSEAWLGCQNVPVDSEEYAVGYNWIVKTMEQYYDRWKNDSWIIRACEQVVSDIIYEDDEIRVLWKAKVDKLMDLNDSKGVYSMDHKTMKQNRESVSNNPQFMGQCIVTKQNKVIIDKIGFQKSLKPEDKFVRVIQSYTTDRLNEFRDFIVPQWAYKIINSYESDVWEPNFNQCESKYGKCQFYKDICSVDRGMREEGLVKFFKVGKPWDPSND